MTTLVTGGTGTLGRQVVRRLVESGHEVRVASRSARPEGNRHPFEWARVDYRTGEGLASALSGARTVVHCATSFLGKEVALAEAVSSAARRAGCSHLVYISIVGVDRIPLGYYRTKRDAEEVFAGSGVGWSVLRATQFHDLCARVMALLARSPVVPCPRGMRVQPIDVRDVAVRLAAIAEGEPVGRAADIGGPEVFTFRELALAYLAAKGRRGKLVSVGVPGATAKAYRAGHNLVPGEPYGRITFRSFLDQPG
ncbi:NAD(P)H-binding protein [Saccharomonospora sp. NPDC006951]